METTDLLKKIKKIEIKSKGLSNQIFSGEYHSAFKGRGMTFSEVREYQYGDEIRAIDWNVTARFNHPFVKIFEEEREMTVMLVIDVSGSENFGSQRQLKKDLILELAATLAFAATTNNDKIGVILFSDKIEKFIPPKKGKTHILRIISELIRFKPEHTGTDVSMALKYLTNAIKRRSTTFVISDFMSESFIDALKLANKKHDLIALRVFDSHEMELPDVGLMKMMDYESGKEIWVDTSDKKLREQFKKQNLINNLKINDAFNRSGVDYAEILTHQSFVRPLMNLFKKREKALVG